MVALWITVGLIISTLCVSILGATFSIVGIGALFSGALIAVWAMAASLELAKFVLAAYVHQRWAKLNILFKSYLVFAIVVLSGITSMGIFGFLSDAYQSASLAMDEGNIKLEAQKTQLGNYKAEIARLNKSIEEIPENRISRRMKLRTEIEPMIATLNRKIETTEKEISQSNLKMLEIKKKVGPLIYISRAFKMEIDDVVKYLILVFVSVFDPLAICLVIAMSQALDSRRNRAKYELEEAEEQAKLLAAKAVLDKAKADALAAAAAAAPPVPAAVATENVATPAAEAQLEMKPVDTAPVPHGGDDEEMILMRFADDISDDSDKKNKGNAV